MRAVVQKWGNSFGLRIPAAMAERKQISEGTEVELLEKDDHIIIQPNPELTLENLLAQITPENRPEIW